MKAGGPINLEDRGEFKQRGYEGRFSSMVGGAYAGEEHQLKTRMLSGGEQTPMTPKTEIPPEWLRDFEAAAARPLELRMRYAFIRTYKPVMDDASYRSFDTMEDYRQWCEENLPSWLGYGRV